MRVIGLTGGVGSGKSYIAGFICRRYPILHINTDDIARRQLLKGGDSYDGVVAEFGTEILDENGEVDRPKLATIVFGDASKLERLNQLTHPNVTKEVKRIIDLVDNNEVESMVYERPTPYSAVLVETAILKEAGYVPMCSDIIFVRAPKEDRIGRIMKSRGYSYERAEATLASQASDSEFESYCTAIVDNPDTSNEASLLAQIRNII